MLFEHSLHPDGVFRTLLIHPDIPGGGSLATDQLRYRAPVYALVETGDERMMGGEENF
jgi:hypothetical protein